MPKNNLTQNGYPLFKLTAIAALLAGAMPLSALAETQRFNIPAQPLDNALTELADSANLKLLYPVEMVKNQKSQPLSGNYSPQQALQQMLAGTGITAKSGSNGALVLAKNDVAFDVADNKNTSKNETQTTTKITTEEPTLLETVNVVDKAKRDANATNSKDYAVTHTSTATKTDTPIMETPASIQVIPKQVIEDQQAYRLQDVIKNVSGVQTYHSYGGQYDQFVMRGFLQSTVNYRNGIRIPFAKFDLANVERVEVLKGASAMLYGFGDPGGMISTATKQPSSEPHYSIEQRFGSYDFYRTEASATGALSKENGLNYRLDFSYLDSGSFRQNMSNDRVFFAPTVSWQATSDTKLTLSYEYFDDNYTYDYGTPAFGNQLAQIPISKTFSQPGLKNKMTNHVIDFRIDQRVNDNIKLNAGAVGYLTEKKWEGIYLGRVNENPASPAYQQVNRNYWLSPEKSQSVTAWINGIFDFETYAIKHKVLLGGEFHHTNLNYDVAYGKADTINLFTFDPQTSNLSLTPNRSGFVNDSISTQNTSQGIYAQDQMTILNKLHILGGFRYDWVQRNQSISWWAPEGKDSRNDTFFSPKVGILYEPVKWLSVYGSFSESFGPSNDYDNGGRKLYDLFTATQFEGGVKTQFFDGKLTANFAYFDLERTQFFQDPNSPIIMSSTPVKGHSNGIEFDMQGQLYEGLSMIGTYAYTNTKIKADSTNPASVGNRLPYAPEHQGSVWLKYEFNDGLLKGFSLGGGVYASGRRFGDPANSYFDKAYARLDLMAGYKMKLGDTKLTTQLNINNVNDAEYYSLRSRRTNLPAEPLTLIGSIKLEY